MELNNQSIALGAGAIFVVGLAIGAAAGYGGGAGLLVMVLLVAVIVQFAVVWRTLQASVNSKSNDGATGYAFLTALFFFGSMGIDSGLVNEILKRLN